MRPFRFSRFAIVLMIACFLSILFAIGLATEMARTVQMGYPGPNLPALWWPRLPGLFATAFAILGAVGAIGYGVLFAFRRSGLHRLSRLDIPPAAKTL